MHDDSSNPTTPRVATTRPRNSERREVPRYPFIARAEQTDLDSATRISARVSELSLRGCYLDTLNPFPKGTWIRVLIFHGDTTFTACATVVYPQRNLGMGVEFSAVEPKQLEVLRKWLAELSAKQCET